MAALRVVGVSGSTSSASRTTELVTALIAAAAQHRPIEPRVLTLAELGGSVGRALHRGSADLPLTDALDAIETADLLIVATPVYRGAYAGLFKHLFDLVHQDALSGVPVLLAATGGSARHSLVIEHQLRPLFAFFGAITLPIGVYAADADFVDGRIATPELEDRIHRAVATGMPLVSAVSTSRRGLAAEV